MTAPIPYMCDRGGVFYYVRRVPKEVTNQVADFQRVFQGRLIVRWSLKTKDKITAMQRYQLAEQRFDSMVREVIPRSTIVRDLAATPPRPVTPELLAKIRMSQREASVRPFRLAKLHIEQDPEKHQEELDRMVEQLEEDAERIKDILYGSATSKDRRFKIAEVAASIIATEHIDAPPESEALSLIQLAVREGLREGINQAFEIANGSRSAIQLQDPAPNRSPRLSAVVSSHIARQDRPRTVAEFKEASSAFIALHGDLPLDEIKRRHFIEFCQSQAQDVVGGRTPGSVRRPKSPETIQKKVRLLRSAISTAIKLGSFDGPNPAADIDVSLFSARTASINMPAKRRFQDDELKQVFSHPWFTGCESATSTFKPGSYRLTGEHFWVPVVALLTGCRAAELGGLMLIEVKLEAAYPHFVIQNNTFRPTKSGKPRKVPMLDQLLELGFADFVQKARQRGHTRLFENWKPPKRAASGGQPAWSNGQVVRSFNERVIPQALREALSPDARNPVTFHSFRGAFKNMLGRAENRLPPNYVNYVVGHSLPDLDQRYVGEIDLGELYAAIKGCRFASGILPTPPDDYLVK